MRTTKVCSLSVLGIGGFFTLTSHLHADHLLQLPPSSWPVPYESALSLLFCGAALFYLFSKNSFSKVMGIAIFGLGLDRFANYFLNISVFNLDDPNKMHLLASFGFMFAGILFFLWTHHNRSTLKQLLLLFLCTTVIFLGSFSLCFAFSSNQTLNQFSMHFYVALGLVITGTSLLYALLKKEAHLNWKQFKNLSH